MGRVVGWNRGSLWFLACLVVLTSCGDGSKPPDIVPGCAYQPIDLEKYGGKEAFQNAPVIRSQNGVLETTLTVAYAEHEIAGCPTSLRNYNGSLVGPTLRLKPGDTLRVLLENRLPPNMDDHREGDDHNGPHALNTTNLHTHGFWVSPSGVSDNVLLKVEPGTDQQFVIEVPEDHAPGTFWYHAHVHGSTAVQVGSGMEGALIVEGGLDDVPEIAAAADQTLLLQHILYNQQGEVVFEDIAGPGMWQASMRQPTINGQMVPVIRMRPGEVQRWRLIHGGIHETIMARLEGHTLYEIALDGLALGAMNEWDQVELQPGYRVDVLVKANALAPGDTERRYFLYDAPVDPSDELRLQEDEEQRVLAAVIVSGAPMNMPLPNEAELAPLVPHPPITDAELDGDPQFAIFDIASRICPVPGEPCIPCEGDEEGCATRFMINDRPFSDAIVRELELDTASEWTVSSARGNHPYHIHVNPFEVTRLGPDGEPQKVFKDTYLIKADEGEVKLRSRYERFTGRFVMHCHILDHEDNGMMELIEIVE